ncbi:MAG: YggS family pyridoxal phosphate enzyme [Bacteroides sp.]|nr:YggS family pyridoxal phosphate enzyme [Prevotella sp.]MCM1407267.1 YggS family pyridoxal phosphate enzyme [Treponema brennaborense]MCM1469755.1 YggS family pyridoxal phosphate enzyme [Bacteroides sp.]
MTEHEQIKENIERIRERMNRAAERAGRNPDDVALMAVSKFHPQSEILSAVSAGQHLFGENRVQEAASKFQPLRENDFSPRNNALKWGNDSCTVSAAPDAASDTGRKNIELHLIGSLQRNKISKILPLVSCIQSVDRMELLESLFFHIERTSGMLDVLFEYHTGEQSKSGFRSADAVFQAIDKMHELRERMQNKACGICLKGFMTMAPFSQDIAEVRASFRELRELRRQAAMRFPALELPVLSMGMSSDFETAIEEGSTLVRIGTAIFGEREAK